MGRGFPGTAGRPRAESQTRSNAGFEHRARRGEVSDVERRHLLGSSRRGRGAIALVLVALGLAITPGASAAPKAPAPPPTPAQVAALGELQREADRYAEAARDYRGVITRIVQHHYEDRRRRVM